MRRHDERGTIRETERRAAEYQQVYKSLSLLAERLSLKGLEGMRFLLDSLANAHSEAICGLLRSRS